MANDKIIVNESFNAQFLRNQACEDKMEPIGWWDVELYRDNKLFDIFKVPNAPTNVGKNLMLNSMFNAATQISSAWCIGLIDQASFSALAATDTMSSHSGWIEFTTYTQSTRVTWGQASSTAQLVSNTGSPCVFDISAASTLNGIFIAGQNTKGGTSSILWSTGSFPTFVLMSISDQIKMTYNVAI